MGKKITTIQDAAFYYCQLDTLILPPNLETFGAVSFGYCSGLKYIVMPNSITEIPANAFAEYVPAEGEEQKLYDLGYSYRAEVAVAGVLSSMVPYITLSLADVEESGVSIANQFQTYAGGVYVYADGVPGGSITALTIECRKAVSV